MSIIFFFFFPMLSEYYYRTDSIDILILLPPSISDLSDLSDCKNQIYSTFCYSSSSSSSFSQSLKIWRESLVFLTNKSSLTPIVGHVQSKQNFQEGQDRGRERDKFRMNRQWTGNDEERFQNVTNYVIHSFCANFVKNWIRISLFSLCINITTFDNEFNSEREICLLHDQKGREQLAAATAADSDYILFY